ncbi:MAG: ribosome maturation factor RimP [Magnetococcus sp. YQC-5]
MSAIPSRLLQWATEAAEAESCQLVDVELVSEGGERIVRVFLEKKDDTLQLDDCAAVSERLSALLDLDDLFPNEYRLEVSSPGLTRPLKKIEDFIRFQGRLAVIQTYAAIPVAHPDGTPASITTGTTGQKKRRNPSKNEQPTPGLTRKIFKGELQGMDDEDTILILVQGSLERIPFKSISKASLDFIC